MYASPSSLSLDQVVLSSVISDQTGNVGTLSTSLSISFESSVESLVQPAKVIVAASMIANSVLCMTFRFTSSN